VGSVADAEQTGGAPLLKAINLNGKELYLVPGVDLCGTAGEEGHYALDALLKGGEAVLLDLREGAFGDNVSNLKVVDTINEHDKAAVVDVAEGVFRVAWLAWEMEPEDVEGNAVIDEGKMRGDAGDGVATVAADGESGGDFDRTVGSVGDDAGGEVAILNESGGFPTHAKGEAGEVGGLGGEEVEEVPLGHERDEFGVRGKVREVGHGDCAVADKAGEMSDLGVRKGEEFFEEAEFVEEFECRGMDRVAAEVAEEIFVFFEDRDGNSAAS
jgi:hypothetical protein